MPTSVLPYEEQDKQLIQRKYRELLKSIKSPMSDEDQQNIRKAFELAVRAHSEQRRKSGEPYILHPIAVARICAEEIGLGPTAIVAALLHDVVEDTDVTLEDIRNMFGEKIAKIVDGLTKLDGSYDSESPQAENFKKVLSTLVEDVRVVLIKMADRLHNMRTLGAMPRHKQLKIAAETSYIYAPLAHRLGLYSFKTEFQDLCMKITDFETYSSIAKKLNETKRARNEYIEEFIKPLREPLDELGIPYRITGRPKSIYSIWNKIKTKKVPFEQIYDLFAVRVIIDVERKKEKPLCWAVYSIVTDVYKPIPERLKDWITTPKSNGYESLHTTVVGPKGRYVEVQIRTERMDEIAERGFAAHWKYKGVGDSQDVYETWLDGVREILENPTQDALEFLSDFKTNLFQEEVYVTTPKGEMVVLPKGATALDFAFHIHTDIGYHCKAIKVNNRIVRMGYKLQNGDQVEVITDKNQKPNEDWIKLVVTGKARSKIRSAMKEERRKKGELGKEILARKFKNHKVDFEQGVETLVNYFEFKSHHDLYYEIALGHINLTEVLKKFEVKDRKLVEIPLEQPAPTRPDTQGAKGSRRIEGKPKLLIGGEPADQYTYSFANCCNPVQGDNVFAYLTVNAGIKIHRSNCPNAAHLLANYGYRVMKAEWIVTTNTSFVADLKITGIDAGRGVIKELTEVISSKLGINIRSFSIEGNEGYYEGKISLLVANKDQLNLAIRTLEGLDIVSTVERLE
ncbi:MAG: bifunctional (p)ppGpp synthetase/guanosine-3',5'-bis(diphosphate) 3'-pyrophosphohydrolase [Bacteroidetes bacterium]|nr:MAG: bifunctional (p)ppGpp synthetase/guanosine-3',5'-bis(diphosphate) 3'-pyrophosphohydrolase [Bacteroidota bacterium]